MPNREAIVREAAEKIVAVPPVTEPYLSDNYELAVAVQMHKVEQIILSAMDRDDKGLADELVNDDELGEILTTGPLCFGTHAAAAQGLYILIAAYRGPVVDRAEKIARQHQLAKDQVFREYIDKDDDWTADVAMDKYAAIRDAEKPPLPILKHARLFDRSAFGDGPVGRTLDEEDKKKAEEVKEERGQLAARQVVFDVCVPSELAAGIRGFTDTVFVTIESGEPGGEPGEFEEHIRCSLSEWFDGGTVTTRP